MTEHPCQIANLSEQGATFITSLEVPAGLQVVAYLDEIGRVEAYAGEAIEGGFNVTFILTPSRRERIQQRIEWLKAGKQDEDGRRHARIEPTDNKSHITLPDGRVYPCEVIDISVSGAAMKTEVMPSLGTYLLLGKMRGRVVRYLDSGIAIEFVRQLDQPVINGKAAI